MNILNICRTSLSALVMLLLGNHAWAAERPNILLIINDQHNGSIMTQRGYPYINTPAIDKLADEGVTFTRAYTPYPICKAMRYSLMTGMMVSAVCPDCEKKFENVTSRKSLGMRMKEAGYETAYFGKWHVGQTGLNGVKDWHGFDTYQDHSSSKGGDTYTRDSIIEYLQKPRSDKPLFMVASFMNPHDSAELGRLISGFTESITFKDKPVDWAGVDVEKDAPPLPANFAVMENEPEGFTIRRPQGPEDRYWSSHPTAEWTEEEWRRYMWGYDRLVEMMDAHVGLIVGEFEKQGLLDNTVIIFTSDHGDGHASHQWNMKMSFYEEAVNIPFIVTWKGKTRAGVIDDSTLISNALDINTTLLSLAGVEPPEHFHGLDLMPLVLEDPGDKTFTSRDFVVTEMLQVDLTGRMVAGDDYKYILFDGGENPEVLFDLANDPGELMNVANDPRYRDKLLMARQTLRNWVRDTGDTFNIASMPGTLPGDVSAATDQTPPASAIPGDVSAATDQTPPASTIPAETQSKPRTWGDRVEITSEDETTDCGADTKGIVQLEIAGEPGDSFRVYLRCGDENVTKCTARVNRGSTTATCKEGPRKSTAGEYRCTAKPSVNNSPAARIISATCE